MSAQGEGAPKWYRVYYALAALDVITVLASLTLSYFMAQIYIDSVAMSQRWAKRESDYRQLAALARAVNAPGNDVFESQDAPAESARLRVALDAFNARLAAARADAARNTKPENAARLASSFDQVEHTMQEMLGEAKLIFTYFDAGLARLAGQRMATMDRKYGSLNEALAGLPATVASIRHADLNREAETARTLRRLEHLVLGLAMLMIAGALYYGSRIRRAARAAEAERAAHLEALSSARAEADAANRAKSKFLAAMSHEIRTPLSTMLLALDMLEDSGRGAEKGNCLAMARCSARSLKQLTDDLLQFFKTESDRMELECVRFDLRTLLGDLLGLYQRRAAEKGLSLAVRIDADVPGTVQGDPLRFGQIVTNLVDNAVKFTHAGSIDVSVWLRGPGARSDPANPGTVPLHVAVRDTGVGLGPEERARIFDEFMQADQSTTRKYGGIGLGLAIARRLVERMNGELDVCSVPAGGSTFWFNVDLQASAAPAPAEPVQAPGSASEVILAGRRVLLVEDAPDGRTLLAALLRELGMHVDVADNGSDAVTAAGRSRYDAILMDIAMPVMDGFEATRHIREREQGAEEVPIIALSAHATNGIFERCLDAGMDDYVAKPLTRDRVVGALLRWIEPAMAASECESAVARCG